MPPENVRLPGSATSVAGVAPVPDSAISTVVLDPLRVIERLPLTGLAFIGVNTTSNVVLWLGRSVRGKLRPV